MGIIDLVGRGLGCEMCGIVSASREISFQSKCFVVHIDTDQKSHILELNADTSFPGQESWA